jgi:periodic tryptophan protein 2
MDVEKEGEIIFAGGIDPFNVYIWSYRTGKLVDMLEGYEGPISKILYSNNYQNLIIGSWDKTVRVTKVFS